MMSLHSIQYPFTPFYDPTYKYTTPYDPPCKSEVL